MLFAHFIFFSGYVWPEKQSVLWTSSYPDGSGMSGPAIFVHRVAPSARRGGGAATPSADLIRFPKGNLQQTNKGHTIRSLGAARVEGLATYQSWTADPHKACRVWQ